MKKFLYILFFALLIFLSIVPRSVELINRNYIFLLDQGRDYLAVKDIVIDHNLTLIGSEVGGGMAGIQGVFHGPFYFYLLSIPFIIFDGDPWGGIVLMFLFGILTIIAAFLFGKKVFNSPGMGIVLALLVAASPPLIAQSRFVWNPHPSSFFILVAFYFIYLLSEKKKKYFFLAAFFSGLTYNFDTALAVPISVSLVIYAIYLLRTGKIKHYLSLISGFVLAYLPFLLFQTRHGFGAISGIINYLFFQKDKESFFIYNHSSAFVLNFFDTFPKQSFFPETLILIVFALTLLLFIIKEENKQLKHFSLFMILLSGVTFFILSFLRNYVFPYYLIHLNFVYIFLFCYILFNSIKTKAKNIQIIFFGFLILLLFEAVFHAQATFRKDLKDYGGMAKVKGKIEAIDYIYQDAKGEKFGLLIFSPPVYTYPYDYLIWWYGGKKYGFLPNPEKSGLFYLLIEEDHSQPWTYKGWLETVIKEGRVMKTEKLPSGFIVQKRINE
ncbi:MAG: glycosyltransferase family 39 protein [Candidatus Levybacteria bacterium]|nr:glycosyltransferase family 39 protein [Candidatus Levybacteria bacterium]